MVGRDSEVLLTRRRVRRRRHGWAMLWSWRALEGFGWDLGRKHVNKLMAVATRSIGSKMEALESAGWRHGHCDGRVMDLGSGEMA